MIPSVAAGGIPVGFRVTWDRIVPGPEQIPSDIIPLVDDTYDLGSSSKYFASAFITTLTADRINPTSGAGLGINSAALDYVLLDIGGSFTSGGGSNAAAAAVVHAALTGASGDTSFLAQVRVGGSITTQAVAEAITTVAGLYVDEPGITLGAGSSVTNAVTLYIVAAPTEGTNNYAAWIDAGAFRHDGRILSPFQTFDANDATPSVALGKNFATANAMATTVTAFDDGVDGQEIFVKIADANTTIDFTGTALKGNGGADWVPASGDFMRCVNDGTNWLCSVHEA